MSQSVVYSGADNLEVMKVAKNYNRYLKNMILRSSVMRLKGLRVLDFGCGLGNMALKVQNLVDGQVFGFEVDESFVRKHKELGLTTYSQFNALESGSFDYIYSLNVIEHIEDDAEAIRDIKKLLKAEGEIFLFVPAFQFLYSSMDKKVGHYRRYTYTTLVPLLEKEGFEVLDWSYADSAGVLATLAYKFFGNANGEVNQEALKIYDKWVFPISQLCDFVCGKFVGKNIWVRAKLK